MNTIYLAGLINSNVLESLQWRIDAEIQLNDVFKIISPLRGKLDLAKITNDGGLNTTFTTHNDITLRDFNDIKQSDILLAHLELWNSSRSLLGTIAEMAWFWEWKKPIIAICKEDNTYMRTHPFVVSFVTHFLPSVDEAIDFLRLYYI